MWSNFDKAQKEENDEECVEETCWFYIGGMYIGIGVCSKCDE